MNHIQSASPTNEVVAALLGGQLEGIEWEHDDDLCDCTYQRIGFWTNPYLGETLKYRFCCIWAKFAEMFPDFVQVIPAYFDGNSRRYIEGCAPWDGESDMPRAIWYRQLAHQQGRSLTEIRAEYADLEPPKGVKRPYRGRAITVGGVAGKPR